MLFQVSSARSLDDLQHTLMHLEFGFRAAVLLALSPDKILGFSLQYLNELRGGRWATLKHIRRMAVSCCQVEEKDTHIRWPDISDSIQQLDYIDNHAGQRIAISLHQVRAMAQAFRDRAQDIMRQIRVKELSPEQLPSVRDGGGGAGTNIALYNSDLVEFIMVLCAE